MKKWVIFLVLGLIALAFIVAIAIYLKDKMPEDFEVYYEYTQCGLQRFNSLNNLYSKTICDNEKVTSSLLNYTLNLSNEDKKMIYESVVKNDFFSLFDEVILNESGSLSSGCTPSSRVIIEINSNGKFKRVSADCGDDRKQGIGAISRTIREVISKKEQEMNIPQANCLCF